MFGSNGVLGESTLKHVLVGECVSGSVHKKACLSDVL